MIAPLSERSPLSFSRRAARRPGIAQVKDFLVPRPMFSPVAHQKEGRLHRGHPVFAGDPVEELWWGFTVIASGDSCSRRSYFHSCFLTSINSLVGVSIRRYAPCYVNHEDALDCSYEGRSENRRRHPSAPVQPLPSSPQTFQAWQSALLIDSPPLLTVLTYFSCAMSPDKL